MGGCIVLCSNALPETHREASLKVLFCFWHGAALWPMLRSTPPGQLARGRAHRA